MSAHLEQALNWIMEGENIKDFRRDFNVIFKQVESLSDEEEISILKKVHANCASADEGVFDTGVRGERSYGWEQK